MSDGRRVKVLDPSTNEVKDVAPEEAQEGFTAGRVRLVDGQDVALTHEDGTSMVFPADKVPNMVNQGWRFSNAREVLAEKAKNQPVQAAAEGALSELTAGASDFALRQLGVEGLAERRETSAGAVGQGVGLVGSVIGPGLIGKLSSGVAKAGLSAAMAPTLAVNAAGQAVERAAAGAMSKIVANRAVNHAVSAGLGRAVEGSVYGAGYALSEAALGDEELNASTLLSAAGMGALVGVATGAPAGALRGVLERRTLPHANTALLTTDEFKAAARAAGAEMPDSAADWLWPKMQKALAQANELVGFDKAQINLLHTPKGRAVLQDVKKHVESSARGLKGILDQVADNQSEASQAVYRKLRPEGLEKLLPKGDGASVLMSASDALAEMRAGLNGIVDNGVYAGMTTERAAGLVKPHVDLLDEVEFRILKAAGLSAKDAREYVGKDIVRAMVDRAPIPAEAAVKVAYEEIERAKRVFAAPAKFSDELGDAGARELADQYRRVYDVARNHLEDTAVYGAAGDMQRELNAAYHARSEAFKKLRGAIRVGDDGKFDSAAVAAYVGKMNKMRGDDVVEAIGQWRDAQGRYADATEKFFPGSGIKAKTDELLRQYDLLHNNMADVVSIQGALGDLNAKHNAQFGYLGSGAGAGLFAGMAAGPMAGMGVGLAAQAIFHPGRFAINAASAAAALDKTRGWLRSKAAKLVDVTHAASKLPYDRALNRATNAMLNGKTAEERQEAYDDRVAEIVSLANPASFGAHASTQLLGVTDSLPNHAAAMTATGQAALALLQASMPNARPGSGGGGGPLDGLYAKPRPNDRDLLKFAQIDAAIQDPFSVFERAADGKAIYRHEVQAIEVVHGKLLQSFRVSVTEQAGSGKRPPRGTKARNLGVIMGVPEADPRKLHLWQSVHQMSPTPPPPRSRPSKPKSLDIASSADRFESYPRR